MAASPDDRGQMQDMVWWTSSSTQQFGGPMSEWISPGAARQLVEDGTILPPTQTECTVPAEVRQAGGPMMMSFLYGYGPQADFAYPPRPEDARQPWNPEWIARVRFRSNTMQMLGMPGMGAFGSFDDEAEAGEDYEDAEAEPRLPACRGPRGIAERAAGLCE